jgi:hypothetical protein
MVGIAASAIQFIVFAFPIERIDKTNLGVFCWFGPERRAPGDRMRLSAARFCFRLGKLLAGV